MFGSSLGTLRADDFRPDLGVPDTSKLSSVAAALQLEILALWHQLQVLNRSRSRRLRLVTADPWLCAWLSRSWAAWRTALVIVRPETVIAWHRQGFRMFWRWKSRRRSGRPAVAADVRALIRTMSETNPLWGAPRIQYLRARSTEPPSELPRTSIVCRHSIPLADGMPLQVRIPRLARGQ